MISSQKFFRQKKDIKPKYRIGKLVRTADLRRTFSKGDRTNWF